MRSSLNQKAGVMGSGDSKPGPQWHQPLLDLLRLSFLISGAAPLSTGQHAWPPGVLGRTPLCATGNRPSLPDLNHRCQTRVPAQVGVGQCYPVLATSGRAGPEVTVRKGGVENAPKDKGFIDKGPLLALTTSDSLPHLPAQTAMLGAH